MLAESRSFHREYISDIRALPLLNDDMPVLVRPDMQQESGLQIQLFIGWFRSRWQEVSVKTRMPSIQFHNSISKIYFLT